MFEIKNKEFYMDGKPIKIYSGAMHYFRTVPEYWEDRLTKLKLAGFNTVETYTCWNLHEPKPGEFHFDGILDIERFVKTAYSHYVILVNEENPETEDKIRECDTVFDENEKLILDIIQEYADTLEV